MLGNRRSGKGRRMFQEVTAKIRAGHELASKAKEIPIEPEHRPGIYDSGTLASCVAELVMDITEECPVSNDQKVLLIFTRAKCGRVVLIYKTYGDKKHEVVTSYFLIDELSAPNALLEGWGRLLECPADRLLVLMKFHAPY